MVAKYVFEMKMSLFQRVALSQDGAHQLLQHSLIERLADMDVLHEGLNVEPDLVGMYFVDSQHPALSFFG